MKSVECCKSSYLSVVSSAGLLFQYKMEKCDLAVIETNLENEFPSHLDIPLKQIIENEGYVTYEVEKRSVSSNNNNYLAFLYEINIKGVTKNGEVKETNIFTKCIRPGDGILKLLSLPQIYKTELFAYGELMNIFQVIQEEASVPINKRYKTVRFYEESTPEAIIMENMTKKGFKIHYRMDVASLQFVKLCIQELAKFHALSFALKEKRSEYFDTKLKTLKNPMDFVTEWPLFVGVVKNLTAPFIDDEFKERVDLEFDILVDKYVTYFDSESTTACLCHGDYRPGNILTKMENGEVQDIFVLDYQMIQYGSPVIDFLFFIYSCTDREFRKAHLSELKDLYYDTLGNFLRTLDVDPESVYPRKEFERAYEQKLSYGLAFSLLMMIFMFVPEDGVADLVDIKLETDDRYKGRLREVIEEYIEIGYF